MRSHQWALSNLVDCSNSFGVLAGCDGGNLIDAMKYMQEHGVYTEKSYPYVGYDHHYCIAGAKNANFAIKGFTHIPRGNEKELQRVRAFHGPFVASIDVSHSLVHYHWGWSVLRACMQLRTTRSWSVSCWLWN